MSDNDDDYMCEEEEDYGLVSALFGYFILFAYIVHDILPLLVFSC